jgi:hypothetical protein
MCSSKKDAEFTTPVSFNECRRRLEIMHAELKVDKPPAVGSRYVSGFWWFGKPKFILGLRMNGYWGLSGTLEDSGQGTTVKLKYQLYRVMPRFITVMTVVFFLYFFFTNPSPSIFMIYIIVGYCGLINIIQWASYFWQRHQCKGLEKQLREALSPTDFNESEYEWVENQDKTYILVIIILLAVLIPICAYLEFPKIMR